MDCFLHIGTGKAGSTAIQRFLARNRQALLERGYLYPSAPGFQAHHHLSYFARRESGVVKMVGWMRSGFGDFESFQREFSADLRRELASSTARYVIFSDEILNGMGTAGIERLRTLLAEFFETTTVIVYLRSQASRLPSRYQQNVRMGSTDTLEEYVGKVPRRGYNYYRLLSRWSRVFGRENLRVRLFEPDQFAGGSLLSDFLHTVGLDGMLQDLPEAARKDATAVINPSLDSSRTEFLRQWNPWINQVEDPQTREQFRRDVGHMLARRSEGPAVTVPEHILDDLMTRFRRSNAKVAREYLDRPDGTLFARRTNGESPQDPPDDEETFRRIAFELAFDLWQAQQARIDKDANAALRYRKLVSHPLSRFALAVRRLTRKLLGKHTTDSCAPGAQTRTGSCTGEH